MLYDSRRRRMRLFVTAAIFACWLALAHPGAAHAGWPLASAGRVVLGFGASYRSTDATSSTVHHGVDIAAEAGQSVLAPLPGKVTFAGRVPAAGGGTALAVTIATDSGSITLMPLADAEVPRGANVAEGGRIGALASAGDASTAETHIHVGLKRGDLYLDPLSVIAPPVAAPGVSGSGAGAISHAKAGVAASPASAHASAHGAAASHATGAESLAPTVAAASTPMRVPVAGMRLAPGVTVAGAPAGAGAAAGGAAAGAARHAAPTWLAAPASPSPAASVSLGELAQRALALGRSSARAAGVAALATLAAVGALWPLWRRREKGSGEGHVSAMHDDVAAAVGR